MGEGAAPGLGLGAEQSLGAGLGGVALDGRLFWLGVLAAGRQPQRAGAVEPHGGRAPAGGLAPSSFAFVSADNFLARNLPGLAVPAARAAALFAASAPVGNYSIVNNRIINGGIRREAVAAAARKAVQPVTLRAVSSPAAVAGVANRGTLAVYRPDVSAAGPEAASPAGPFLLNKPRAQPAQTPPAPQENAALLADVPPAQSSVLPARLETVEPLVQLPPLRYGALPRDLAHMFPLPSAMRRRWRRGASIRRGRRTCWAAWTEPPSLGASIISGTTASIRWNDP